MLQFLLQPVAWLFGFLVWLKNFSYDRGLLPVHRLDKPVISIGNLAMGGTGKSPVTIALAEILLEAGYRVAVLSRGYGRRDARSSRLVEADGDWSLYGDEPVMIKRRLPQICVSVGPSRAAAAAAAVACEADVYLIDDGFQHRRLARDLDIVLLDVTQPRPRLFPLEKFREGSKALARADLVLLTRWDGSSDLSAWEALVRLWNDTVPIARVCFEPGLARALDGTPWPPWSQLRGTPLAAYSGIAQPQKFFASLRNLGLAPLLTKALGDHEPLSPTRRTALLEACHRLKIKHLLTTEKDAVKLEKTEDSDILWGFLSIDAVWEKKQFILDLLTRSIEKVAHDEEITRTNERSIQGNGARIEDGATGGDQSCGHAR